MKKHVALTGFMAAGKSTIGKKLARNTAADAEHGRRPIGTALHECFKDGFERGEALAPLAERKLQHR